MKALALEMLVLSKMFVMDTWDRAKDFVTKVLFLCLVVPALRVKARDLGDDDAELLIQQWISPDFPRFKAPRRKVFDRLTHSRWAQRRPFAGRARVTTTVASPRRHRGSVGTRLVILRWEGCGRRPRHSRERWYWWRWFFLDGGGTWWNIRD